MGVDLAGNLKDLAGNALVRGSAFIFSNLFMALIWRGINAKIEKARPAEKGATRDRLSTTTINIDSELTRHNVCRDRMAAPGQVCINEVQAQSSSVQAALSSDQVRSGLVEVQLSSVQFSSC